MGYETRGVGIERKLAIKPNERGVNCRGDLFSHETNRVESIDNAW
jgi:hypothetical protein